MSDSRKEFEDFLEEQDDGDMYSSAYRRAWQACQSLNDKRIAQLEAELAEARKDAERYKRLKELALTPKTQKTFAISKYSYSQFIWLPFEEFNLDLDSELDKAINQAKETA